MNMKILNDLVRLNVPHILLCLRRAQTCWVAALYSIMWAISTAPLWGQTEQPWRAEGGITFSHFQQQVKQEIGGRQGERLVNETSLGVLLSGSYAILEWLEGGLYIRTDVGERSAGRFAGFDSLGSTEVTGQLGGSFSEFWAGPFVRASWKSLSAEIGYGAVGVRSDDARTDLPSASGDTASAFTTSPVVAWMVALGANVPITTSLDLFVKAEYRVRYYVKRGGEDILTGVEHGTQSIAPIIGVGYRW